MNIGKFAAFATIALTAGLTAGDAMALDGQVSEYAKFGTCNVRARVYDAKSADVTLQTSGDPTSGGVLWINGQMTRYTAINPQSIEACGFEKVRLISQNGADGTFEADDYMGFKFSATFQGVPGTFEAAIVGATNTHAKFSYEFYAAPPVTFNSK